MANPKGNPQNLQPIKSVKEAKKKGRKGGIRSQQVQRERRKARECMEQILSLGVTGDKSKQMLKNLGIKDEEQQNIMLLMSTLFLKAATTGEPNAVKAVLEIAGELEEKQAAETTPTININIAAATQEDMEED